MSFQTEFPDFDASTLPAIPAGFADRSWANETMPCFISEAFGISIWVDYADTTLREYPEGARFSVQRMDPSEHGWQVPNADGTMLETDNWTEVEDLIASINQSAHVAPIKTLEEGKAFIEKLHVTGGIFHFDDSPEEIGNYVGKEWVPAFSKGEALLMRRRVADLYELDWSVAGHECPIGYALEVIEKAEARG